MRKIRPCLWLLLNTEDKQIMIDNNVLNYIISRMERSLNFAIKLVNTCDKEALKKHSKVNKQVVNIALDKLLNT